MKGAGSSDALGHASKIFAQYVANKKIIIADMSGASRAGLSRSMIELGAKSANIHTASSYKDAVDAIRAHRPHVIIADYDLGGASGLTLLQEQREGNKDAKQCLFILVTGNTSQSAVAQAAEEDVDTFILKPYTLEILRASILRAAAAKLNPGDYAREIEAGKKLLLEGDADGAMQAFDRAKKLDPKPSLACFYHGQAQLLKKSLTGAQGDYERGLTYNKIHYKCMVGLFDLLIQRKNHAEAYDVAKRLSRYFPANPKRLTTVLRLAVVTKSYEDVERYYQIFTTLDQRNDELIRYVCAALVVCGKYYIQSGSLSRAMALFQKAATTASGRVKILREIMIALISEGHLKEAHEFLAKFPPESQSGPDYLTMEYALADAEIGPSASVDRGRKLIAKGIHDPLLYQLLIHRSKEANLSEATDTLVAEGSRRWPDLKQELAKAQHPLATKN